MSAFVLKIIAIITMFIDHIGYIFSNGKISYFNYIGRLAFPIFAFQISEGYLHTKNLKKYFLRLFLFALISQIPFMLYEKIITDKFSRASQRRRSRRDRSEERRCGQRFRHA